MDINSPFNIFIFSFVDKKKTQNKTHLILDINQRTIKLFSSNLTKTVFLFFLIIKYNK